MKKLYNVWVCLQSVGVGFITPLISTKQPQEPPKSLFTFKGFLIAAPITTFLLIEFTIQYMLEIIVKIIKYVLKIIIRAAKYVPKITTESWAGNKSILDCIIKKDKFKEWFNETGFFNCDLGFYEKYLYYKYYYKMLKHLNFYYKIDDSSVDTILDEIKTAMEENRKNYMTLKLAGVKDQCKNEKVI